ncbi:MAG: MvaI/BcnI family restriction endonuclease [Bacilli bacterium]|nr:MvaI/BcnI family restriction endonuclease [Bacilli bacterium]
MFFPNYQGIEIKCTTRFSRYPISLFSKSFDDPSFFEMNRLINTYGTEDNIYKGRKILMANLKVNEKISINNNYYFELKIDKKKGKIYINIYDNNNKLIENEPYISFNSLKEHLEVKLTNLAIVYASKKEIDDKINYRYYKMCIYKLISFDKFIELLENSIIKTSIIGRISLSGNEEGRQRNKNLLLQIQKENILYLFNTITTIDL